MDDEHDAAQESPAPNIFREGKFLVVPRSGAVFPLRCVKTNEPVDAADYPVRQKLLVSDFVSRSYGDGAGNETWGTVLRASAGVTKGLQAGLGAAGGAIGGAGVLAGVIASIAASPVLEVRIGLSPRRRASNTLHRRLSLALLWGGAVLTFVGLIALLVVVFSVQDPRRQEDFIPIPLFGFLIGFPSVLVGAAYYMISGRPVIAPGKHDERYAWFSGSGEPFRESLPEFPLFWDGERWRTKEWPE